MSLKHVIPVFIEQRPSSFCVLLSEIVGSCACSNLDSVDLSGVLVLRPLGSVLTARFCGGCRKLVLLSTSGDWPHRFLWCSLFHLSLATLRVPRGNEGDVKTKPPFCRNLVFKKNIFFRELIY